MGQLLAVISQKCKYFSLFRDIENFFKICHLKDFINLSLQIKLKSCQEDQYFTLFFSLLNSTEMRRTLLKNLKIIFLHGIFLNVWKNNFLHFVRVKQIKCKKR